MTHNNFFFEAKTVGLGRDMQLMSFAIVSNAGNRFYAELNDFDESLVGKEELKLHRTIGEELEGKVFSSDKIAYSYQLDCFGNRNYVGGLLFTWMNLHSFSDEICLWGYDVARTWTALNQVGLTDEGDCGSIPFDLATIIYCKGFNERASRFDLVNVLAYPRLKEAKKDALSLAMVNKLLYDRIFKESML